MNRRRGSRGIALPPGASIPYAVVALWVAALLFLGGSASADFSGLLPLRLILVAGIALSIAVGEAERSFAQVRPLYLLLGAWTLAFVIQLLPVPPALWRIAHGGMPLVEPMESVGLLSGWRPLSLTPDRTWSSLLDLLPVAAGILCGTALSREKSSFPVLLLIGMALFVTIWGIAQAAGGPKSPLYIYTFSTRGLPAGAFANRNHFAVFLAAMIPILRAWSVMPVSSHALRRRRQAIALGLAVLFIFAVLVSGSRAGAMLVLFSTLASFSIAPLAVGRRGMIVLGVAGGLLLIAGIGIFAGRAVSLDRLSSMSAGEDLRFTNMPAVIAIVRDMLPFGSGFGSFDPIFRTYEADDMLDFIYFNNAHNDLLELALTGGVVPLLVMATFLMWAGRESLGAFRSDNQPRARAATIAIVVLLAASLVDYPLRTPLMGFLFALFCGLLAMPANSHATKSKRLVATHGASY